MTLGGLIVMTLSVVAVLVLLAYCLFKVFTMPPINEKRS